MNKKITCIFLLLLIGLMAFYFWPEKSLDKSKKIDKIQILKDKRLLIVFSGGQKIKTYNISLGKEPVGRKEIEGDAKTPEGIYFVNEKNPKSGYHLNLGISYPNEIDKANAMKLNKSPGGLIKIHGITNGFGFIGKFHRLFDWTQGCIAVTNSEIEELYENVPIGTEIEILK